MTSWRRKNPSLKNSTIWTLIPCFAKIICRPNLFGWLIIVFIYGSLHTFAKGRKKMEIRREILRFLLRVHLATAINAPMFHNYHFDVFQDYELFYKSRNKVTCASWAVWQILLMLLSVRTHPLSLVKKVSLLILNQYLFKVSYTDLHKILSYRESWQSKILV